MVRRARREEEARLTLRLSTTGDAARRTIPARPAIGPALEFAGLGAALTFTTFLMARLPSWRHDLGAFQGLFALAFACYAIALARLPRYAALPGVGWAVLAVALATRVALFPVPPSLSDDLYRYVWEGRVLLHGGNPWRQSPLDPALAPLRDAVVFPAVNHPELATIYPPLAEAGFALVAAISPTVWAMKLWVIGHDLALVALLAALLRAHERSPAWALVYAWNPLALVEYAGSGHNDPTAMAWLAGALLLARARPSLSALALAAGALVKLAPLLALPFLWRGWRWRARLLATLALAVGLGWFVLQARGAAHSGLFAYGGTWRNNDSLFALAAPLGQRGGRIAAALALAACVTLLVIGGVNALRGTRDAMRAGYLLSPVAHPWYQGWFLMLEPLAPSAPWLLLSATAILSYGLFAPPAEGRAFHLPAAWRALEYGAPALLALALAAWRGRANRHRRAKPGGPGA
jgi:hypothetical protein